jgi:hypothetical protein
MTLDDLRRLAESGDNKAWLDYAIALGNANQHQQALEASEHLDTADGYFIKGVALSKLGRSSEALDAVQPPFLSPLRNIEFSAISETWDWGYLVAQAEPFRLRLGGL